VCADLIHRREIFLLEAEHVASMPISLELHAESVMRRLLRENTVTFTQLIGEDPDSEMVVVTFLSILELYKRKIASIRQDQLFGDIVVTLLDPTAAEEPFELEEEA